MAEVSRSIKFFLEAHVAEAIAEGCIGYVLAYKFPDGSISFRAHNVRPSELVAAAMQAAGDGLRVTEAPAAGDAPK